jgi:hypothetical protein
VTFQGFSSTDKNYHQQQQDLSKNTVGINNNNNGNEHYLDSPLKLMRNGLQVFFLFLQ